MGRGVGLATTFSGGYPPAALGPGFSWRVFRLCGVLAVRSAFCGGREFALAALAHSALPSRARLAVLAFLLLWVPYRIPGT